MPLCRHFLRGRHRAVFAGKEHGALHPRGLHADLRGIEACGTLRGAAWETRGVVLEPEGSMPRLASLAALLLAVFLIACGGGGGAADADPASAIPRDALFYVEATARPEGELRSDALEAAGKILRTEDPEAKFRELLDEAEDFDYDRDVKPWLGDRAGMWVSGRLDENEEPGVAGAIAVTDREAAEEAINSARERKGVATRNRTHAGVEYTVAEDSAYAFVDDFVLFGDEPELRRTIDALQGDGLADHEPYQNAIEDLEGDRLAHFYVDTRRVMELAAESDPQQAQALKALIPFDRLPPVAGALLVDGSRLAIDVHAELPPGSAGRLVPLLGTGGSPMLEELPADAWGAQAMPRFGETIRAALKGFAGAIGGAAIERQLGFDLERDLLSWVGDAALFIRGDSIDSIDGGLVLGIRDKAAAESAFGRIVGALQARQGVNATPVKVEGAEIAFQWADEAPKPIVMARGEDKVVVAYGTEAAADALSPDEELGDSELYERTTDLLGDDAEPSFLLSLPAVVKLVDAAGDTGREWQQAKPYVETFDIVAIGGSTDGGDARVRFVAGLK